MKTAVIIVILLLLPVSAKAELTALQKYTNAVYSNNLSQANKIFSTLSQTDKKKAHEIYLKHKNKSTSNTPNEKKSDNAHYWAAYAAQELVGKTLKAPATAQWPGLDEFDVKDVNSKKDTWLVSGYVDAQNSYGAMIRTHFKATIKKDKNGDMLLVGLKKRL